MKHIIRAMTLMLVCATAVPAAAQSRAELQMAAELRMLQEQAQQLALTLGQLGEAIKALNARIDESNKAAMKGFADQDLRVKNLGTDISAIREGTQDSNTRLGQLRDEVEAMRSSLTSLPSMLSQYTPPAAVPVDPNAPPAATAGAPAAPGVVPAPAATQPPPPAASTLGLSPTRMYSTALADYHNGQYGIAILGFEQFLRQFPNATLSDDAHFYTGEAHAAERRFEQAIASYDQVIQNFPTGDQILLAYYKRGIAEDGLGQTDAARASFEAVIKLQPNSPEAGLAKQGLDRIANRKTPARPE